MFVECVGSDQAKLWSSELMEMRHFSVIFRLFLAFLRFALPHHGLLRDHMKPFVLVLHLDADVFIPFSRF